jgi:hypothetical protein
MSVGYCTVEDVRRALRKANLPGDAVQDRDIVIDAIAGTFDEVRKSLDTHFYVPGGISEDTDDLVPTDVRTRGDEQHDIPSTPHPQHSTLFSADRGRYPRRTSGPYVEIRLGKFDVQTLTNLEVRDRSGDFTDWTSTADKTAGDEYRLFSGAGTPARSTLELHAGALPPLDHYDRAVRVSYEYGAAELPRTVRRGAAFLAASELAEDAVIQIPENTEVRGVESLADFFEQRAMDKLDQYR